MPQVPMLVGIRSPYFIGERRTLRIGNPDPGRRDGQVVDGRPALRLERGRGGLLHLVLLGLRRRRPARHHRHRAPPLGGVLLRPADLELVNLKEKAKLTRFYYTKRHCI